MYQHPASRGQRYGVFAYGVASYAVFLAIFVYLIGFIGDLWEPAALDSAPRFALLPALAIDVALLVLFAVQHSAMARPAFKRWWSTVIPPAAERGTYVLASSAALALLMAGWQPLGGEIWRIEQPFLQTLVWGVFAAGWALILVATIGRFRAAAPLLVPAWFSSVRVNPPGRVRTVG